jgi:undecaprenyl-phosphate galactose phosphotransferase
VTKFRKSLKTLKKAEVLVKMLKIKTITKTLLFLLGDIGVFYLLYHFINSFTVTRLHPFSNNIPLNLLLFLICLLITGNYHEQKSGFFQEVVEIFKAFALLYLFYIVAAVSLDKNLFLRSIDYYAKFIAVFYVMEVCCRFLIRFLLYQLGFLQERIIIYGAGKMGEIFLDAIIDRVYLNYHVVGLIDDDPTKKGNMIGNHQVLGGLDCLEKLINERSIDKIVVAIPTLNRSRLNEFIFQYNHMDVEIEVIPDLFRIATPKIKLVSGIPVVATQIAIITGLWSFVKRVVDIIGSIVALILFMPIILITMVLIYFESPGPILFCQERLGRNGTTFKLWKFRSMYVDAEEKLQELLQTNEEIHAEYEKYAKITNDPRITKIGYWIRKFSIDEFPQLYNSLKGDISLVGPRPYLVSEKEKMDEFGDIILMVKPGITGLWQIRGRNNLTFRERLRLEAFYVRRWSTSMDIWILLATIPVVFFRKGAK